MARQRNGIPIEQAVTRSPTSSRGGSTNRRPRPTSSRDRPTAGERLRRRTDAFGRLWTPHRLAYIQGAGKPSHDDAGEECPFCRAPKLSDEDGLIVARGQLVYAVLNLYPYNAGT